MRGSIAGMIVALAALATAPAWAEGTCDAIVSGARAADDGLIDGNFRAALEAGLDGCTGDAYFIQSLARARAQAGLEIAARLLLDQAERDGVISAVEHERELGWVFFHTGRHDEARARGESLIQRWPEWPDGYALVAAADGSTRGYEAEQAVWTRFDVVQADWITGAAVRALDDVPFWVSFAGGVIVALLGILGAGWGLKRRQLIGDLPTSRIHAAAQGYVEIKGRAIALHTEPLLSPRTRTPCVWYRYTVYKRTRENNREVTRVDHRSESGHPFALDDGTGRATLDPAGADVSAAQRTMQSQGDRSHHEEFIQAGEQVHAIGWFRSTHEADTSQHFLGRPPDGRPFLVSSYKEETSLFFARAAAVAGGSAFLLASAALLWLSWHRFQVLAWPA